jgi:hypothetical protein
MRWLATHHSTTVPDDLLSLNFEVLHLYIEHVVDTYANEAIGPRCGALLRCVYHGPVDDIRDGVRRHSHFQSIG